MAAPPKSGRLDLNQRPFGPQPNALIVRVRRRHGESAQANGAGARPSTHYAPTAPSNIGARRARVVPESCQSQTGYNRVSPVEFVPGNPGPWACTSSLLPVVPQKRPASAGRFIWRPRNVAIRGCAPAGAPVMHQISRFSSKAAVCPLGPPSVEGVIRILIRSAPTSPAQDPALGVIPTGNRPR
jgi:hypothetical protein